MIGATLKARLLVAAVVVASHPNLPLLGLDLGLLLLVGLHLDIVEALELLLQFVLPLIVLLQRYLPVLPDRLPLVLVFPELTVRLSDLLDQSAAAHPLLHAAAAHLPAVYLRQLQERQLTLVFGAPV
jgi:hypothetical protein